jgi:hypothetical protein
MFEMAKPLDGDEILEQLKLLADWIRVKYPGDHFELVLVGGAAMALDGHKEQTRDVDVIRPEILPEAIVKGVASIGKIRRLGPRWLNSDVANMLQNSTRSVVLPDYFKEVSRSIEFGDSLRISLIGRQAMISLKLYASTPSYGKHTDDINRLKPTALEITEAVRFVLSIDDTDVRKDDLRAVLKNLRFDFDGILRNIEAGSKRTH